MTHAKDETSTARRQMVAEIERLVSRIARELGHGTLDARVLSAMRAVPRHEFVPLDVRPLAYKNRPLPIGHGQTISQPFIVALMSDLAQVKPEDKVLEVGTGCGYQTAVLSRLARDVFSIEIVAELGEDAADTLRRLGFQNVTTRIGDGYQGWPEHAPFDAILVTAAADHVPPALVAQLKPGGRLVIPVGSQSQELMVIEKRSDGTMTSSEVIPVRFVPLVHETR